MTRNHKLLPCPWCGDKSPKINNDDHIGPMYVTCQKCGMCGPDAVPNPDDVRRLAVNRWNELARRARR